MKRSNIEVVLESVNCNLCGSDDFKFLYKKPDTRYYISDIEFNVVKCRSCGLAFVNPRPTLSSMRFFYPKKFYQGRRAEDQEARARYEREAKYLESFELGRILDIGCAGGAFLKILQDKGWEVYGMDYFNESGNIYNLDIRYGELDDIRYPFDYFDVVTAWGVFEHLHNPMKYFKEVSRILRLGGHFVFLVTNINSLMSRYGYAEDIPRHLYFFSERTLKGFAEKSNLLLVNVEFSNDIYSGTGRDALRVNLLRRAGVSWKHIYQAQSSFPLCVLDMAGRAIGWLIRPSIERLFRCSGIMVATARKS